MRDVFRPVLLTTCYHFQLLRLQTEHSLCQKQIALTSNSQTDQLTAITTELLAAKNEIKQLQDSLRKTRREKEMSDRSLELEKSNCQEVQEILTSMRGTLEKSTSQIETLHSQLLIKSSALQEKERQIELLQSDLKGCKEDHKTATTSCQAMQFEVNAIKQALLSKTAQLEEEHKKRSTVEADIVEMSGKLKEKESLLQGERTLGAHVSNELEALRIKSNSLEDTVASKEATLQGRARELMEVNKEKAEAVSKLSEMEEQLQMAMHSKDTAIREMTTKVSELQAQNRELQQVRVSLAFPVIYPLSSLCM